MQHHYHETWKPQESIIISFDDKTAEKRSAEQIDRFFQTLRDAAGVYGFDIQTWGNNETMYKWLKVASE